ncbi:MAG: hypothetical protein ACM3ML_27270 [Micromonosporaceae bacterium]
MDDTNWGNQPQYHSQQPGGYCEDAATIPGQPGLTSHFARKRGTAVRWAAGIIAAAVLAGGGAIAGMDLLGGGSSSNGSFASAPSPAGSATAGPQDSGLDASGPSGSGQAAVLSSVLSSVGLPATSPSGSAPSTGAAAPARARHLARVLRRLHGLHGEFTVRKPGGGFAQIAFERGTVVSASGTSVVVRAADGTTWTWTLTSDTVVRKDRAKSSASDLSAGDLVFAAGTESGSVRDARLVIARDKQASAGSQGSPAQGSSTSQN